ncbi:MAG: hypothetical protein NTNFB02_07190 [Nitrospira sp.]
MIHAILTVLGTMAGFLLAEGLARVFLEPPAGYSLYNRDTATAHTTLQMLVSDPRLVVRIQPNAPGHDERGFRNREQVESADVVVIGDSQTWGVNVSRSETWPSVLAAMSKVKAYSMSLGGWGPLQYELLAGEALALKPQAILIGIYLGNDLFDSCNHVYGTDSYVKYRHTDEDYSAALADLLVRLEAANGYARVEDAHKQLAEMGRVPRLWQELARRSLLIQILMTRGLLPSVPSVDELYLTADMTWALDHPEAAALYEDGNRSTVLTFGYRGVAVDLQNACIREGVRITKDVLTALEALSIRAGVQIGVVLIPTKEAVYAEIDPSLQRRLDSSFTDLVMNENAIKADLLGYCKVQRLVCMDAAIRMVEAVKNGSMLYRQDSDGHPIAEGYRQIAWTARQVLEQMRLPPSGSMVRMKTRGSEGVVVSQ